MEKHCGVLGHVGALSGGELVMPTDQHGNTRLIGSYRSVSEVDAIAIGATQLKRPMCEDVLWENLTPGREGCLYVWRNGRRPLVVGVKYTDGEKFLVSNSYFRGSLLQMTIVMAFMYGLGGMLAGGFLAGVLGLEGSGAPMLVLLGGAMAGGMWWWRAWSFLQAYRAAKAD